MTTTKIESDKASISKTEVKNISKFEQVSQIVNSMTNENWEFTLSGTQSVPEIHLEWLVGTLILRSDGTWYYHE